MKYTKEDIVPGFKFFDSYYNRWQTVDQINLTEKYEVLCIVTKYETSSFKLKGLIRGLNNGKFIPSKRKIDYEIF